MLEQNQSGKTLRFVAALVCVALASSLITYWSTNTYEAENASLQQQIADLQKQIEELKNPPAPEPTAAATTTVFAVPTADIKFTNCGAIDDYKTKDWYAKFTQTAATNQVAVDKITNVCYSENGKVLVMIIPAPQPPLGVNTCENGSILRYDIANNALQAATILDKGIKCLGWPTQFGKRENSIIKMEGIAINSESVKPKMYYDYDFIKNVFELKKSWATQPGDEKGQWTNY